MAIEDNKPQPVTDTTFKINYRDYYDENDGYHRVLFNSGRALQARELIELQTIIQEEISRFGGNVFKEGALVKPGGVTVDNKVEFVRFTETSIVPSDIQTLTHDESGIKAKVLSVDVESKTIYVQYTDTLGAGGGETAPRFAVGDRLEAGEVAASGLSTWAYFASGDYFVQGHFVHAVGGEMIIDPEGTSYLDADGRSTPIDIGFKIEEVVFTESEDPELYDNQGDVVNQTSPGAHRYKIILTPSTREQSNENNFVFVARVLNGEITREVTSHDGYNRINKLLAQRTKEESGDYVVQDFTAVFEDKNDQELILDVSEGIAYVDGYRLDIGRTEINVPRAQSSKKLDLDNIPASYGNWVYLDLSGTTGLGDIANFGKLDLIGSDGDPNNVLGSTFLRGIEEDQSGFRAYIFNTVTNVDVSFSEVHEMVTPDGSSVLKLRRESDSGSTIYSTTDNNLLFPLSQSSPVGSTVTKISYTQQVVKVGESPEDDNTISILDGRETQNWILSKDGVGIEENVVPTLSGTYENLDANATYTILYYQTIQPSNKSKTLTSTTISVTSGYDLISSQVVDGYEIENILLTVNNQSSDITFMYEMDNGQRDNFYDFVRFNLKPGNTIPDGAEVSIRFKHFEHSTTGGFFSAASYGTEAEGQLTYDEIPSYTMSNGNTQSLRDVIDFRPSRNSNGTFKVMPLPQNASSLTLNEVEYYLPRIDVLVANVVDSYGDVGFGELQVIQGQPAVSPRPPEVPTGSLPLYVYRLNAYTFNSTDLTMEKQSHKRYTMKDIAKIENRLEGLYELTTLSLLESSTQSMDVLDSSGNPRTKAGFIADNFSSFNFSDVNSVDYRASVETTSGELQPSFRENLVRLKHDESQGSSSRTGDYATLPYTHASFITQDVATSTMNINPFSVITQEGHITLSPSSDEWVETQTLPPIMQTVVRRTPIETGFNDLWRWENAPGGIGNFRQAQRNRFERMIDTVSTQTPLARSIQEFVGERVAGVEVIPFMRSRLVSFKAEGLRPNAKVWAYFGNRNVSAWCRPTNTFVEFSTTDSEVGSSQSSATGIVGSGQLTTNDRGEVVGEFLIPNTDALRFRTGTQDFQILDINVNTSDARLTRTQAAESLTNSTAPYTSTGTIESIQRTIRTTRIPQRVRRRKDPLAQSFFVDPAENPNGIFLTKVRVYVQSKDSTIPMQVQIRPVENGIPTTTIVPGSVKFVKPDDITLAPNTDIASIRSNGTTVEFDEPVYLTAGEEYAIVLLAESVEYNVYVAQTYETIIGGNEGKVSKQPSLGSLFMSQSGSTWTPDQTKDLMFELERAEFDASGAVHLINSDLPSVSLEDSPFSTTESSNRVLVRHEGHGFTRFDQVTFSGSTSVGGLDLNGTFTIDNVTSTGYTIVTGQTTTATSTSVGGSNSVIATQNVMFDEFTPQVSSIMPNGTSVSSTSQRCKGASYAGDGENGRNPNSSGLSYNRNITQDVVLNEVNTGSHPSVIATTDNKQSHSIEFILSLQTSDSRVSPLIDLQRVSMLALENIIGDQSEAQHTTRPTTIDESSVGLKVVFGANRPTGSTFEVYIKTSVDDDSLVNASWIEMPIDSQVPSDDNISVFREYEYTQETSSPFNAFQVKVVMKSNNSSKSPRIRDLRVIALAT
jgi:hypothetical protein